MLWEVEIRPLGTDRERNRVAEEYNLLTHAKNGAALVSATARGRCGAREPAVSLVIRRSRCRDEPENAHNGCPRTRALGARRRQ